MDENRLQAAVIQGWRTMLLLMMTMTLVWILKGNLTGELHAWMQAKGEVSLWFWAVFFGLAASLPLVIGVLQTKPLRWLVFLLTVLWAALFIWDSIAEWVETLAVGGPLILLQCLHHLTAIWTAWLAYRWARGSGDAVRHRGHHLVAKTQRVPHSPAKRGRTPVSRGSPIRHTEVTVPDP